MYPVQWRRGDLLIEQLIEITLSLKNFKTIIKPSQSSSASNYSHALAILNNVNNEISIPEKSFLIHYFNICIIFIQ